MNLYIKIFLCFMPVIYLFCILGLSGCLENNTLPEVIPEGNNAADMLVYFETHGDYINSIDMPSLVDAAEVYNNLAQYLIIDTRRSNEFIKGHIGSAVNIQSRNLLDYLKNNSFNNYTKIVLVSATGQASAYYTAVLRLNGFNNVYSLNFGMASWHSDFASLWLMALATDMNSFTNDYFEKNPLTKLPDVSFNTKSSDIKDKIEERSKLVLAEEFEDNSITVPDSESSGPAIDKKKLFNSGNRSSYYLICYGQDNLYEASGIFNPYLGKGHPAGAILYGPYAYLKSSMYLQTLPLDKTIAIYCGNGQMSAAVAAYLKLLGYNAKSLLFGANSIMYDRLVWDPTLTHYAFGHEKIGQYPYSSGN
ncbi:MAG: rhodanese-like domain-containing protein [Methanococcaceae archaeon]